MISLQSHHVRMDDRVIHCIAINDILEEGILGALLDLF